MLFRAAPSKPDFEREVMPHLRLLHGVALRMTRAEGDAEDLVQETVLRAYRFWDSFEAGTNCKAWLLRILTNSFRNRYRAWEREQEIMGEAESLLTEMCPFSRLTKHVSVTGRTDPRRSSCSSFTVSTPDEISSSWRTTCTIRESQCSQTVPQGQGRGQGFR